MLFPLLFLTAAALATWVLMRRLVTAERPTIGMLRACGYSSRQVVRHYLTYGVVTGLAGGVLGAAAGARPGRRRHRRLHRRALDPGHPGLGLAADGAGRDRLRPASPARWRRRLPAASAARVPPAEAMRALRPVRPRPPQPRRAAAAAAAPGAGALADDAAGDRPQPAPLALDDPRRRPRADPDPRLLGDGRHDPDPGRPPVRRSRAPGRRDLLPRRPRPRKSCDGCEATAGVAEAEAAVDLPVSLSAGERRYQTALKGFDPRHDDARLPPAGGGTTTLPADGVLAGAGARRQARRLSRRARSGSPRRRPGSRRGRRSSPSSKSRSAPTSTRRWGRSGGSPGRGSGSATSPWSATSPGSTANRCGAGSATCPASSPTRTRGALRETVDEYLGLFYVFIGVMLIFGAAMAFALLYNSIPGEPRRTLGRGGDAARRRHPVPHALADDHRRELPPHRDRDRPRADRRGRGLAPLPRLLQQRRLHLRRCRSAPRPWSSRRWRSSPSR